MSALVVAARVASANPNGRTTAADAACADVATTAWIAGGRAGAITTAARNTL